MVESSASFPIGKHSCTRGVLHCSPAPTLGFSLKPKFKTLGLNQTKEGMEAPLGLYMEGVRHLGLDSGKLLYDPGQIFLPPTSFRCKVGPFQGNSRCLRSQMGTRHKQRDRAGQGRGGVPGDPVLHFP